MVITTTTARKMTPATAAFLPDRQQSTKRCSRRNGSGKGNIDSDGDSDNGNNGEDENNNDSKDNDGGGRGIPAQ
jgi:hypothetical protein